MLVFATLALVLTPLASAGPVTDGCHAGLVCIAESSYVEGDCDDAGFESGSTSVNVAGVASVTGASECYTYGGGYGGGSSSITVSTPAGNVFWLDFWYNDVENGEFHGCYLYAFDMTPACPASPPNPGWGNVLP
jgi:hypothetical protein